MPSIDPTSRTVFIRGVTPRSGTNYLRDLLLLHPDLRPARAPIWEDFALDDAAVLHEYSRRLSSHWLPAWGIDVEQVAESLMRRFGDAVVQTLVGEEPGHYLAKTPSAAGLEHFPVMFPGHHLVLLVRDGRDAVESLVRSFGWSFERALRAWRIGAEQILAFRDGHLEEQDHSWLLLRYEDVLTDPAATTAAVFRLAGLSPFLIDTSASEALPVRGSSATRRDDGAVSWEPVPRDAAFAPIRRWADWDNRRHRRFGWVAGEAMRAFGYELEAPGSPALPGKLGHHVRDAVTAAELEARRLRRKARARHNRVTTERPGAGG